MTRPTTVLAAAAGLLLALAGCASAGPDDTSTAGASGDASGAGGPVTIDHAFGSTEVPADPQRVVTLGWGSTEAALALGVVPVGIESQTYAADENGRLPWVTEALEEAGGAEPTMIPASVEQPAYEDIGTLQPDVILAPYSGITKEQYDLLSEIAPTVAYPEEAWTTPWRDVITTVGTALGLPDEGEQLVADLDAQIDDAVAEHPEIEGKTVAAVMDVGGTFWVYRPADARVAFLEDLGLTSAPAVEELATDEETFAYGLSYEKTDQLDSDVLVAYAATDEDAQAFLGQSYAQAIPAVAKGAAAMVIGDELIAAMSPPNALSIDWGLDEYVSTIAEAATAAG